MHHRGDGGNSGGDRFGGGGDGGGWVGGWLLLSLYDCRDNVFSRVCQNQLEGQACRLTLRKSSEYCRHQRHQKIPRRADISSTTCDLHMSVVILHAPPASGIMAAVVATSYSEIFVYVLYNDSVCNFDRHRRRRRMCRAWGSVSQLMFWAPLAG